MGRHAPLLQASICRLLGPVRARCPPPPTVQNSSILRSPRDSGEALQVPLQMHGTVLSGLQPRIVLWNMQSIALIALICYCYCFCCVYVSSDFFLFHRSCETSCHKRAAHTHSNGANGTGRKMMSHKDSVQHGAPYPEFTVPRGFEALSNSKTINGRRVKLQKVILLIPKMASTKMFEFHHADSSRHAL